ncbi:MAG: Fic family protein [Mycoplasmataceae bacterium]|jgi:Fic family protein|nr:Fic family protein [Mycoplasmataceae bacterium]
MENLKTLLFKNNKLDKNSKLYRLLRDDFTYHSSAIEGSKLSKDEHLKLTVLNLKETDVESIKQIFKDNNERKINDAIENANCIKLFDYVLENYDKELTHFEISLYQGILKRESELARVSPEQVGAYRNVDVFVTNSTFNSSSHFHIQSEMENLLQKYHNIKNLNDIADFHCEFETIHPFRDGNGRVGRMIMFKQCMQTNVYPFIIDSISRNQYLNALEIYNDRNTSEYLVECFKELQDVFKSKYSKYFSSDNEKSNNL